MCRLFGFRSAVPSHAHRSLMEAENSVVSQAKMHPDGWGMAYYIERDAYILKSESGAHDCDRFQMASSRLQSNTFVVHVRRATVGQTDYLNSHPFRFGRWTFAHNGTLFGFEKYRDWMLSHIKLNRQPLILGNTDSEHFFHYLLSSLERAGIDPAGHENVEASVAARVIRDAVDNLYKEVENHDEPAPIVNFILTNGDVFIAMRAGLELYFATQKNSCADFETCEEPRKVCMNSVRPDPVVNHLIVSSEKIGVEDIWEELPQGHVVSLSKQFQLEILEPAPNFRVSTEVAKVLARRV
jgi:predicted glutamine amidotransferase